MIPEALIFCDAEPEQLEFIRRYYMEQWKKEQEKEIENLIRCYDEYVTIGDLHPAQGWLRWMKDYICRSFENLDNRWTWIEALMMQDDDSIFMTRHGDRAFRHLRLLRNYARGAYQREDHGLEIDLR